MCDRDATVVVVRHLELAPVDRQRAHEVALQVMGEPEVIIDV
jgi:hypothetical protein